MKIKFNSFDQVNEYIRQITNVESDVFVKSGSYTVDGKSSLALYSLDLSKSLELDIIEKRLGESERIIKMLDTLGVLIHEES